eukprot:15795559-Heterocapsa_arctica.AAC.1
MEMFPVKRSATKTMAWSSARYAVWTFPGSGWAWLCTLFCLIQAPKAALRMGKSLGKAAEPSAYTVAALCWSTVGSPI